MKSDEHLLSEIESVLLHDNPKVRMKAVGTALLRLMENQTDAEIAIQDVRVRNGIGFTGAHGRIGTSMGLFFKKTGFLTPKQVKYWTTPIGKKDRPRILIYKQQLLEFAKYKMNK